MLMKKCVLAIFLMLIGGISPRVLAASPPTAAVPPGLSLAEIKVTGNEFIMLQNNTGASITDLSRYWLYFFNNVNPLAVGVSSSSQHLLARGLLDARPFAEAVHGQDQGHAAVTGKLS